MTKGELKHEAEEKAKKRTKEFKCQENCEMSYVIGALDFAEPREKRIEELEKEISELKDTLTKINEQNIKDCENFNKKMKEIKEQWNKEHYQLIKAKDLIAKLYHADECFSYDEEVEQFLKESE